MEPITALSVMVFLLIIGCFAVVSALWDRDRRRDDQF